MTNFIELNTGATYRGTAVTGTYEVAGVFTKLPRAIKTVQPVATGFVKVYLNGASKNPRKVLVADSGAGYTLRTEAELVNLYMAVASPEVFALEVEIAALTVQHAASTKNERANLRKTLARRTAKLAKLTAS
jgi:hypothetical protein